jgi:hypothetical protein
VDFQIAFLSRIHVFSLLQVCPTLSLVLFHYLCLPFSLESAHSFIISQDRSVPRSYLLESFIWITDPPKKKPMSFLSPVGRHQKQSLIKVSFHFLFFFHLQSYYYHFLINKTHVYKLQIKDMKFLYYRNIIY